MRNWPRHRVRFFFREIDERAGTRDLPLLSVSAYRGVIPKDEAQTGARTGELSLYKVVEANDLVINRMSAYQGALGRAPIRGLVSPEYMVLRTREGLDPRFFAHLAKSKWFVAEMTSRLRGIGTPDQGNVRTPRVNAESVGNIRIPLPDLGQQRAIADFLDRETARIQILIAKKQELRKRLTQRFKAQVMDELFGSTKELWVPLRRLVDLLPGYSFPSDEMNSVSDGNVRLLRGINIAPGSIRWEETVYVSQEVANATSRFGLRPGDIVIGMDRPVIAGGMRVATLGPDDCPSLLVQRVARIRAHSDVDPRFVRYALESEAFVEHFSPITTGVSVPHISPEQILDFRLPRRTRAEQSLIAQTLEAEAQKTRRLDSRLKRQVHLLEEHKQALITAAVTGQLDVSTAA